MAQFDTPAEYFRFFAREAAGGGSPLYRLLSLGIAEDEGLQALAAGRKPGQPPANILFAAVHYLLLCGADHPLKDYYPSVGGERPADAEALARFRAFCAAQEAALKPLIAAGVTNTNEVGRSAFLAPGFAEIAARSGAPLALIEIGPSAGLNLNFDRYGYRYTDEAGAPRLERWTGGPLTLTCVLKSKGLPPLPQRPPPVARRIGLELNPVDVGAAHDRQWLKALVWPERTDRFAKLAAALEMAGDHPPPVRAGDALDLLPAALDEAPADAALCVYHSFVVYQFSRAMRARLEGILMDHARRRPLWKLSCEGAADGTNPLLAQRYDGGRALEAEPLADCSPHGLWLDWQAGSR